MELIIAGVFILVVASFLVFRKKPTDTVEAPSNVESVSSDNGIKFASKEETVVVTEPTVVAEPAPVVEEAPAKKTRAPKAEKAPKAATPKAPAKKTTTAKSKKA